MITSIQSGSSGVITPPKHHRRFAKMDKNGDGGLDANELAGMAKRTGKDATQLLSELDTNKDGKVDSGEMDTAMAKRRAASGQGDQSPDAAAGQFTTSLMNILKQLQGADSGSGSGSDAFSKMDTDGDGKLSQSEFEAGTAKQKEASDQNLTASAKEFTSSLMNLFKQLQGSGSDQGDAGSYGEGGHCDPATTAASQSGGTRGTAGTDDIMAQFQAAMKTGFSFSQTTTTEMTTLQSLA